MLSALYNAIPPVLYVLLIGQIGIIDKCPIGKSIISWGKIATSVL